MKSKGDSPDSTRLMLAYLCIATEREASLDRKVEILDKFDLTDSDIAKLCGSAVQSIRNARHYSRRHARRSKKSR